MSFDWWEFDQSTQRRRREGTYSIKEEMIQKIKNVSREIKETIEHRL